MNMFLMLLALIEVFLFDRTLGKAIDSQCNNRHIYGKDLRGMQHAKEMLWSDQAIFYTNPWKSETNNSSTFKQLSAPNDIPAITTLSFTQLNVPTNATNTATGLRTHHIDFQQTSLNDVKIAYVSATTAITTATLTQVPASATTNAPKFQLDKCKAPRAQHKTKSPSILHPVFTTANNASPRSPFLLPNEDNSETLTSSLLLFCIKDAPAIMMATFANFSLQLIVDTPSRLLLCDFERP